MKIFNIEINNQHYIVEQPSKDYDIFYVNRKKGTFCIAKDKDKKWIIETQVNPTLDLPVELIGQYIDAQLSA
ncbi:hypothetical protein [Desertivirga xinjiangensis]|uniref:hypothetical protein n=1 Tax=Desertivirga xinjiangensis TaxID=539206 RepID=UPI00210CABA2|nr:hypothetical protein [Pedobacter xinjiangensis]